MWGNQAFETDDYKLAAKLFRKTELPTYNLIMLFEDLFKDTDYIERLSETCQVQRPAPRNEEQKSFWEINSSSQVKKEKERQSLEAFLPLFK